MSRPGVQCIVPPHLLREIAARAEGDARASALQSIAESDRTRVERMTPPPPNTIIADTPQRVIYDARASTTLPGRIVRREGDPEVADPQVNEAYDGLGATYSLFHTVYGRHSIDARNMALDATVHYGRKYDNAFWNGRRMVFGDGDGRIFERFTKAIDVIGHELTHGVTQYEAKLAYANQPGALNESFSDVFGSLVKQRTRREDVRAADWLIGAGLFAASIRGKALRSLQAPGTAYDDPRLGRDPQPAHMRDYDRTTDDNGGVHINSGIPNHAFYLAAMDIGGFAWEKSGRVWYLALADQLSRMANFSDGAAATVAAAMDLFGRGSLEAQAVERAWKAVGVEPAAKDPRRKATSPPLDTAVLSRDRQ